MKPHKPKKAVGGISRARMFIRRDLGWMVGIPLDGATWLVVRERFEAEDLVLTREHLSRATYTINKLIREFPRALPKVVGDVGAWAERHRALLDRLKSLVHDGEAFERCPIDAHPAYGVADRRAVERVKRAHPTLDGVVDAFAWLNWLEPRELRDSMAWLDANGQQIATLVETLPLRSALILVARLWRFERDHGDARVRPLLGWLSAPAVHTTVTQLTDEVYPALYVACKSPTMETPEPPSPDVGAETLEWIEWAARQDARVCRRSLVLFGLVADTSVVDEWSSFWIRLNGAVDRCRRLHRAYEPRADLEPAIARIPKLRDQAPPAYASTELFRLIKDVAGDASRSVFDRLSKCLSRLPARDERRLPRLSMLTVGKPRSGWSKAQTARLEEFLRCLAVALEDAPECRPVLEWWFDTDRRWTQAWSSPLACLMHDERRRVSIGAMFAALAQLARNDVAMFSDATEDLIEFVALMPPQTAADAYRAVKAQGLADEWIPRHLLRVVLDLCRDDHTDFASLVRSFVTAQDAHDDWERRWQRITSAVEPGSRDVLMRLVVDGRLPTLMRVAAQAAFVRAHGAEVAALGSSRSVETPDWVNELPNSIRPALEMLVAMDDDAQRTAERLLGADLPTPTRLKREIDAIQSRLDVKDDDGLRRRLANLQRRLDSPNVPSDERLRRLASKIETSAARTAADRWHAGVQEQFEVCLKEQLRCDVLPRWATEARFLESLAAVGGLPKATQELALRILRARLDPAPWDLRDADENQSFLDRMSERGFDIEPWLDNTDVVVVPFRDDEVRFELERDPIEIFEMGGHFRTCLSPGAANFFSVFSVAADVNKRVLYGRRSDGTVIARCLLALSETGGLVSFHAYCHDKDLQFDTVVTKFAHTLAERIGTATIARDVIPTLVSKQWYDDGPVDRGCQFLRLNAAETLDAVRSAAPDAAWSLIRDRLAPLDLDELTIAHVLGMPVFDERPELVLNVIDLISSSDLVALETRLRAAALAQAAGRSDLLEQLAPSLIEQSRARSRVHWYDDTTNAAARLLAEHLPIQALRLLRVTRERDVRSWDDEYLSRRLISGAMAFDTLHRPRRALDLYRRALRPQQRCPDDELCRRRIATLERELATSRP